MYDVIWKIEMNDDYKEQFELIQSALYKHHSALRILFEASKSTMRKKIFLNYFATRNGNKISIFTTIIIVVWRERIVG